MKVNLAHDTIDENDIAALIEWLHTNPRLTQGPMTVKLEAKWAKWLGRRHSVFCNSGSSANLLMFQALLEAGHVHGGDKVVVPTLSWATTLAPVIQLGLHPILCDCNLANLSVSLEHLEEIFRSDHPRALVLVPALGLSPDMGAILELCNRYAVILLEDACGSMGASYQGQNIGTLGLMSSFSTYFGHHISTIEGGFVCTDDDELFAILQAIRSHGWARDWQKERVDELRHRWGVSDFNNLFTFYYCGFNVRGTDLQAFIGLRQIDKLGANCQRRNEIFAAYHNGISNDFWKPSPMSGSFTSSLAYPIIHPKRDDIVRSLQASNIETRPLLCRPMGSQPFYVKRYGRLELPNAALVDERGLFLPVHASMTDSDIGFVCGVVNKITKEDKR